ncbi:hypothetical protein BKA58DRAFT_45832 [Alternaria rosae]|uniref:uncharacterized protein n=1 Tax=Alternaria rosae TaxID=1187941 RepID=UPI001E8E3347|nr:uncharacterized protein BKA58DRAFT_45832 [Alternaria rosae]KAH6861067.1 hypothetical protein BKA58DRAFT_45832 [Alternaria rosae]
MLFSDSSRTPGTCRTSVPPQAFWSILFFCLVLSHEFSVCQYRSATPMTKREKVKRFRGCSNHGDSAERVAPLTRYTEQQWATEETITHLRTAAAGGMLC